MLAQGQHKAAETIFRSLLEDYNAESYEFINSFLKSKGASIGASFLCALRACHTNGSDVRRRSHR